MINWLSKNGIAPTPATGAGDILHFTVPIGQANDLLAANFSSFVHTATNATVVRTLSYSLPAALQEHVSYVYPTTQCVILVFCLFCRKS